MTVTSLLFFDLWDEFMLWSILVGVFTFGWLYHHSVTYRSKDGEELPNVDEIEVGVFPKENDDLRLEVAWTILPFILIVYLTYISWAPIDSVWTSTEGGAHGYECEAGYYSNNVMDSENGFVTSDCYHILEVTGKQWAWTFECNPDVEVTDRTYELSNDICDTGTYQVEGYGMQPSVSLKAGETYLLVMESEDVTHSPWFIELGVKEDVLNGQQTTMWLPITSTGEGLILCTEYCGDAHSLMAGVLITHD